MAAAAGRLTWDHDGRAAGDGRDGAPPGKRRRAGAPKQAPLPARGDTTGERRVPLIIHRCENDPSPVQLRVDIAKPLSRLLEYPPFRRAVAEGKALYELRAGGAAPRRVDASATPVELLWAPGDARALCFLAANHASLPTARRPPQRPSPLHVDFGAFTTPSSRGSRGAPAPAGAEEAGPPTPAMRVAMRRFQIDDGDIRVTPPHVLDAMRRLSGRGCWPAGEYYDPCPLPPVPAMHNGLRAQWDSPAMLNPPFSQLERWMEKAQHEHARGVSVMAVVWAESGWLRGEDGEAALRRHRHLAMRGIFFPSPAGGGSVVDIVLLWMR